MRSIRCTGPCKQDKLVIFFAPAEITRKRPICRACRKAYAKKYAWSRQIPSANWKAQSSTLCRGSGSWVVKLPGTAAPPKGKVA